MALLPRRREPERAHPLAALRSEMDRLFDSFFGPDWEILPFERFDLGRWPALDVSETDDAIQVQAEVPGMKPEDIDISVSGDTLTITGERREEKEDKGRTVHRVERRYGSFQRTVTLPCEAEVDKASATYKDGILTLTLPKKEEAKRKVQKIEVKKG